MRNANLVMNSKHANKDGSTALYQIEKKFNTLNLDCKEECGVDSTDDSLRNRDGLVTVEYEDHPVMNVKRSATDRKEFICKKDEEEVQNSSNSLMHNFWLQKFNAFMEENKASVDNRGCRIKCKVDEGEEMECNRYYMPLYFDWLKKKVPFITL